MKRTIPPFRNITSILQELKKLGTEQNRKVYRRHGIGEPLFGVSFANIRRLGKQIKTHHQLALDLWKTKNHDARILATIIADPSRMTGGLLDSWVKDLDNYVLTDSFAELAAQTSLARKKMEKWTNTQMEWVGRTGWRLLAKIAMSDQPIADRVFENYLKIIERDIHKQKNHVKGAMNSALIAIGIRNPRLTKQALRCAKKVGTVEVDHGETSCRTPDAAQYIHKTLLWRKRKGKTKT